jgi:hypothetical protein
LRTTATSEVLPGYRIDPVTGAWLTIPWPQDPKKKDLLIASSLGPDIIDWAEWRTDEPGLTDYLTGKPWRFTAGQKRFIILWYAFDARGRWLYRSGVKRGAKGTGKDPFGAALCNIELVGRSQLVLNEDTGLYEGMRHTMPLVQIASNSEAQSKDMLRIANGLLGREARDYFQVDTGETRTILKDGGRLEVLTASEKSSEGDPATFIALNESHHMTESSGGHRIAEVARRNVGKSPAALQARLCEFTNAHRMGTDSVAERTFNAWQAQVSGQALRQDILYDSIEADPATRLHVEDELSAALTAAYSDAPWADLERLVDEVLDPRTSPGDSIRFYLNGLAAAEDAWVDPRKFDALANASLTLEPGEQIVMFLDCSKSEDATGLVGCRLSDGAVFQLGVWQRPHGDRGKGWLAPREEVDGVVRRCFDEYRVEWFGVDPSPATDDQDETLYWRALIDNWHRDFSKKLKLWATPGAQGNSVLFDMRMSQRGAVQRNQLFTEVAMLTAQEIDEDSGFPHDGSSALRTHVHNAKRRPNQWGYSIGKASRDSAQLVDLAVCMVGARMGRGIVLNSGKVKQGSKSRAKVVVLGD